MPPYHPVSNCDDCSTIKSDINLYKKGMSFNINKCKRMTIAWKQNYSSVLLMLNGSLLDYLVFHYYQILALSPGPAQQSSCNRKWRGPRNQANQIYLDASHAGCMYVV